MQIILASSSPRRIEMLENLEISFVVQKVDFAEAQEAGEPINDYVLRNARGKAEALAEKMTKNADSDSLIIAADTIVVQGNKVLEKPLDRTDAKKMLTNLSAKHHEVLTGVCFLRVIRDKVQVIEHFVQSTTIEFRKLSEREISDYLDTKEPYDKSGAYGIQGRGASFVKRIDGSVTNVIGLPLAETCEIFQRHGILL